MNKYHHQRKHDKDKMSQLSFRYNKDLVKEFKEAVDLLNKEDSSITQSSLIRKLMVSTIKKAKKNDLSKNGRSSEKD